MPLSLNLSRQRGELRCRENRSGYADQHIDVHVILESSTGTHAVCTRLRRSSNCDALFQALGPPNAMMEPSAILLASPPHDSAFQIVSGILGPSRSEGLTGPPGSGTHDTDSSLESPGIPDVGPDLDGAWVIEGEEPPRASKSHRLICG